MAKGLSVALQGTNDFFSNFRKDKIFIGRVKSIVLNDTHPRFKELGEWNGLGTIEFDNAEEPTPDNQLYPIAKPLDTSFKNFPLINEIVYIIPLSNTNIGEIATNKINYYINIIGLWNHPHHNAFPQNSNILPPSQQKDYEQTQAGSVRRVTDQSTEIFLGETFKERANIHPLLPFEGDRIIEGRWGNSIRFGSTVKGQIEPNDWSSTGNDGDPITILRNGQGQDPGALGKESDKGWLPITELINNDDSSIYLASTQKVPLQASSVEYNSYTSPPTTPKEYSGKQILINSGRLVFNTTQDHLLLTSKKSINLNAIDSINIETTGPIILQTYPESNGGGVFLGDKSATQSVLLGNDTITLLQELIQILINLTGPAGLSTQPGILGPLAIMNTAGSLANGQLTPLLNRLQLLASKTVKTI
jgi:hypothetical protein